MISHLKTMAQNLISFTEMKNWKFYNKLKELFIELKRKKDKKKKSPTIAQISYKMMKKKSHLV